MYESETSWLMKRNGTCIGDMAGDMLDVNTEPYWEGLAGEELYCHGQ